MVALSVGAIYASHHFFISYFFLPDDTAYHPLTAASYLDEGTFYGLRANAVYNGDWRAGDISLAENLDAPAVLSMLNPLIMGGLGIIAGSFERGIIISDFIFPVLIFLLLYALAFELTGKKKLSLLFTLLFIFAPKIYMAVPPLSGVHLKEFFSLLFPFISPETPLYFTSFEEPKITFPFLAAFMLLAVRAFKRNTFVWYAGAGVGFGVLFYTYLYDWASMLVGMVVLAGLYGWCARDRQRSHGALAIIGIGVAVSAFYWINMWQLFSLPHVDELVARTGREISHMVRFASVWKTYFRNIVLIGGLVWMMRRYTSEARPVWYVFVALASTYFVTVNAQVLIGFNVQPDHWYRTQYLVVALILSVFVSYGFDRMRLRPRSIIVGGAAISFVIGYILAAHWYGQYLYSAQAANKFTLPREREEVFEWLNSETPLHSVVVTLSSETNRELLLYTHNRVFIPNGLNTIAREEEIWDRVLRAAMLFDLNADEFGRMIRGNDSVYYLFSERFTDHSFDAAFRSGWVRAFPEALIEEKVRAYALSRTILHQSIPYRIDYLLFDDRANALHAVEAMVANRFEKIYDDGIIRIYRYTDESIS